MGENRYFCQFSTNLQLKEVPLSDLWVVLLQFDENTLKQKKCPKIHKKPFLNKTYYDEER